MIFVGRNKEITTILNALERGENIVLTGKFGIGRTSLVRHISRGVQNHWRFIFADFSKTAKAICSESLAQLSLGQKDIQDLTFRLLRSKLTNLNIVGSRQLVLVMDNIAKISAQKINLVRNLNLHKQFRFIAITEQFLKNNELDRLRGCLLPSVYMRLSYLTRNESIELAQRLYQLNARKPAQRDIELLVTSTHGYPLGIQRYFQSIPK